MTLSRRSFFRIYKRNEYQNVYKSIDEDIQEKLDNFLESLFLIKKGEKINESIFHR